jgi:hypothetical protein
MSETHDITVTVNGVQYQRAVEPRLLLTARPIWWQ